jgi:DNA polymerase III epsilon subunit family exonuclease
MDRHLRDVTFVVVDLETTGGAPYGGSEITEFGAVKICGGEIVDQFATFVKPQNPIPFFITELTGIDDEMVSEAPDIANVFPQFLNWVGPHTETVLIAHNAPFDISFLKAAASTLEYEWPSYAILDTVKIARLAIGKDEVPNYKLSTLAQFFETDVQPTHRALDDAQTTVEIFHRLLERLGSTVTTLKELQQLKRGK